MISKRERTDTITTIFSKAAIVLINFAIVVCITQFWGAEGKGYQALFIANLGLIAIVTNIFTNSSIAFFVRKVGVSKLFAHACIWIFISSSLGVLIFYYIDQNSYSFLLLISCLLTGYITFHNALYIGMQKIKYFNIITLLQPLFLLIIMVLLYKTKQSSYFDYFYAYIVSLIIVIVIAHFLSRKTVGKVKFQFDSDVAKQSFNYGFQNELSNFLQFLASRLSFYFVVYYLGEVSLGVFSIGVAISESIWIISRSVSMIQYSKIVSEGNTQNTRKGIIRASFFSLFFSLCCVVIILLLPKSIFTFVFGNQFSEVKQIILLMSPGILCTSFSIVYGHYFAAIGKMKVLIVKSGAGTILTIILSIFLIPLWEINGACILNSLVRFIAAVIIVAYFVIAKNIKQISTENNKVLYD
jgi:O-antigen/teichoic acid export membrane protein